MRRWLGAALLAPPFLACSSDEFAGTDAATDASVDATPDVISDAGSVFCINHPDVDLCDDFDRTEIGNGGFKASYKPLTTNGFLQRTNDAVSPSFGFEASVNVGGNSTALLRFTTALAFAGRLNFQAKIKPGASCADGATLVTLGTADAVFTIALAKVGARGTLHVTAENQVGDAGPFFAGDATNEITFDTWSDLEVDVKVAAGKSDAGATLNDVELKWGGASVLKASIPSSANFPLPVLSYGVQASGRVCKVSYDNVVFDATQ